MSAQAFKVLSSNILRPGWSMPFVAVLFSMAIVSCTEEYRFEPDANSFSERAAVIEGQATPSTIASVDSTFFGPNLPLLGRLIHRDEYASHASVAILSHSFWTDHLSSRPEIIGTTLQVDGVNHTVVGVMPQGVDVPAGVVLWVPR